MKIGLLPLAQRAADVARAKKGQARPRLAEALVPLLTEAALVGLDQALIVVAGHDAATLAIVARRAAIAKGLP